MKTPLTVGTKVIFAEESKPTQAYTVQASDERYAICTRPLNFRRTVLYSIIDFEKQIRSTEDFILCFGFEDKEHCEAALKRLQSGDSGLSRRNQIDLNIHEVKAA